MSESEGPIPRLGLLNALRDLGKSGASIDASVLSTYAFNAVFYEEVLLRPFERAGSRLNIVLADARQLAAAVADPLRRPTRAGVDYLLVPVEHPKAFHPKILALFSEKSPLLAIGSHNATDPGFSHNEEVTAFWGAGSKGPPRTLLLGALEYCLTWLRAAGAVQAGLLEEIEHRLRELAGRSQEQDLAETHFLGSLEAGPTLWTQLLESIVSPVSRISVVGPYFDRDLRLLNEIASRFGSAEIVVGLQPGTAVLENPSVAPRSARFVDAAVMGAFNKKGDVGPGFLHGKALLFETEGGPLVTLGSANPTGAAWLGGARGNAEANVLLSGESAARAVQRLGLGALSSAPSLGLAELSDIAARSVELRQREREQSAEENSVPVIAGLRRGEVIFVSRLRAEHSRRAVNVQDELEIPAIFVAAEGGLNLQTTPPLNKGGLVRIDGESSPLAVVVINDERSLHTATRPRDAARLLDSLGRLDSYDGFDEIFDLLQRHVFNEPDVSESAPSPSATPDQNQPNGGDAESTIAPPFGPRGVSLAAAAPNAQQNRILENGLISEVIAALIRALGPGATPRTDGDARDLDEEEATQDELAGDDFAQNLVGVANEAEVDWPHIVTACRKRISVMLNRLRDKIAKPAEGPERAAWLFNRILLALCLLQRLRTLPPVSSAPLNGLHRPASLVSVQQLREAFKLAVKGMYGLGRMATLLEASPIYRASADRHRLDLVLLWMAKEIGADFEESPIFNEPEAHLARRLSDRADVVLVAMSAAANAEVRWEVATFDQRPLRIWDDAVDMPLDWTERHLRLGQSLQASLLDLPPINAGPPPVAGQFAMWLGEPGLPRLVRAVTANKAYLIEPGGDGLSKRPVMIGSMAAIDLALATAQFGG